MKFPFLVASVQLVDAVAPVEYLGQTINAKIQEIEVQLVDETGQFGSQTLHFRTPEQKEYALATYTQGTLIEKEV